MKITTRMLNDKMYEAINEQGNSVTIDMRKADQKLHLSPMELVLSAVAGCAAVDIVDILKKRRKTILSFVIDSDGTRQETAPKYYTAIHCIYRVVSPDVTTDELEKAAALTIEKYCSVVSSLKASVTFSVEVTRPELTES